MKNLILIAAILVAYPVFAQSHPIKVKLQLGDNQESHDVADMLSGRIGSSSRYALVTTTTGDEDILVSVDCVPVTTNGKPLGVACDTVLLYWPVHGISLFMPLPGSISVGSESGDAEDLFNAFVRQTSDEKLAESASNFRNFVNQAVARFPHGMD